MTSLWSPVHLHRTYGRAPLVLLCEHASAAIPPEFDGLGLTGAAARSHAAWDIGALDVAMGLSAALDAPLVAGGVSRLLYDCNRPLTAPDCIPAQSEVYPIPGNNALDRPARQRRFELIHEPFHRAAAGLIAAQRAAVTGPLAVVTIHSFTPVYHGQPRQLDLGFLHDDGAALSLAAQSVEAARGRYRSALNAPYAATDGVTYSLRQHADVNGLHGTMIEIKNDLIDSAESAATMATHLAETLAAALSQIGIACDKHIKSAAQTAPAEQ